MKRYFDAVPERQKSFRIYILHGVNKRGKRKIGSKGNSRRTASVKLLRDTENINVEAIREGKSQVISLERLQRDILTFL